MKTKKQVGLFFGSFNPIHVGHLIIANTVHQNSNLDEIWFVISPQSPFKNKSSLLPEADRFAMVTLATEDNDVLKASNIEFSLPQPSYTINTLQYAIEKHGANYEFHLIMGSDNLQHLHKWKNYELILENHQVYVYNRPGSDETDFHSHKQVILVNGPLLHISASMIRDYIKEGKSVKYLVTEPVINELEKGNFYN